MACPCFPTTTTEGSIHGRAARSTCATPTQERARTTTITATRSDPTASTTQTTTLTLSMPHSSAGRSMAFRFTDVTQTPAKRASTPHSTRAVDTGTYSYTAYKLAPAECFAGDINSIPN